MRTMMFSRFSRAVALALFIPSVVPALAVEALPKALADARPELTLATGDVYVLLQTDPDAATAGFSFSHTFGANSSPQVPSPFTLTDGRLRIFNAVPAGQYSITLVAPTGWALVPSADGYDTGCWDDQSNSVVAISTGVATIDVGAGEFVVCTFVMQEVVDPPPGGDTTTDFTARGLGWWKNSGKCLSGQAQVAAVAQGDRARMLESQLLGGSAVFPLGSIVGLTCAEAARLLGKSDLSGNNKANDAAYNLAAHLLAAKLNKAAGAPASPCVASAMTTAQNVLVELGFTGMGDYLGPSPTMRAVRTTALRLGGQLSGYSGGNATCP